MTIIFEYTNGYYNGYLGADEVTNRFPDTMIMPGCNIHRSVTMGRNCFIHPNVVIGPNCIIGDNVTIRSNTVIGQPGFGIIAQDNLEHIHLPHVGGVWIGHDVEIGALTSVVSGTIHPTIIEPHVKIDDLVHVAHNCYFAKGAQIIAQAQVSGSVYLGEGVWIGPNACVIDRISIGDKTLVGIGSTVIKPLPENVKAVGSPARIL